MRFPGLSLNFRKLSRATLRDLKNGPTEIIFRDTYLIGIHKYAIRLHFNRCKQCLNLVKKRTNENCLLRSMLNKISGKNSEKEKH